MKGPYQRLKHDLRRHWECPHCGRRERTSGAGASCLCPCQDPPVCMRLQIDGEETPTPPITPPGA